MNKDKIIKQGGELQKKGERPNNVKLSVPRLWYPNVQAFQQAVNSALRWDMPRRKELYDLYDSALLDSHLRGVIRKRKIAVTQFPIEFRRDGEPVEEINEQIKSPWFRNFIKSLIDVQLWGFRAYQFTVDKKGWVDFTEIDPRHINPVTREVLEYDYDLTGKPLSDFPNTLFLGKANDCGELMSVIPWIITKRQTTGDWAQYAQIFGMPIREYTYDGSDWDTMQRLKEEAETQGSNGVYFHTSETAMRLVDPSSRSGSSELYDKLMQKCDEQISILLLGNTLTTAVGDSGSRALGDVQKSEEEAIMEDDRGYILDVLNYEMTPIFAALGLNTEGGEWVHAQKTKVDKAQQADIIVKMNAMGLPIDDDYIYETLDIAKPANYDEIKKEKEEQKAAMMEALKKSSENGKKEGDEGEAEQNEEGEDDEPKGKAKPTKKADDSILKRVLGFFSKARETAGGSDW